MNAISPATVLRERCKRLALNCDIGIDYAYPHLYRVYISDGVNASVGLWAGEDTLDVIRQASRAVDEYERSTRAPA